MKAVAFDNTECGLCPHYWICDNSVRDSEGYHIPGPACPLPDVPEQDGFPDTMEYADACMSFVEALRRMK